MNTLNIQQQLNIAESVSTELITKLYETAVSIPLPNEGEEDAAYLAGRLEVVKAYENHVKYLAGNISGVPNPTGRFLDLRIDVAGGLYIRFEDSGVDSICKNKWGDSIGTTKLDVLAVTNIGTVFKDSGIRKFNELKYFGITYLSESAFEDCTRLIEITLPDSVTSLGLFCFFEDNLLSKINVENLISIDGRCFSANDTSTQMLLARGDVLNFKSLTSAGTRLFGGCNFALLYMPKLTASSRDCEYRNYWTRIPQFANEHNINFVCNLLYLRDIQKIYTGTFAGITCSALVINNATPPEWANTRDKTDTEASGTDSDKNRMFRDCNIGGQGTNIIYVPDAAITDYQNHALWGTYCTFKGISELNSNVKYATYEDWVTAGKPIALIEEYM